MSTSETLTQTAKGDVVAPRASALGSENDGKEERVVAADDESNDSSGSEESDGEERGDADSRKAKEAKTPSWMSLAEAQERETKAWEAECPKWVKRNPDVFDLDGFRIHISYLSAAEQKFSFLVSIPGNSAGSWKWCGSLASELKKPVPGLETQLYDCFAKRRQGLELSRNQAKVSVQLHRGSIKIKKIRLSIVLVETEWPQVVDLELTLSSALETSRLQQALFVMDQKREKERQAAREKALAEVTALLKKIPKRSSGAV